MRTSRIDSFSNLSPLQIVFSKNVVSNYETSAVNFMVGWYEFAEYSSCVIDCLDYGDQTTARESAENGKDGQGV